MSAPLRRLFRLLRLALVCLTLVAGSAPAAAEPVLDTIALVASAREAAAAARPEAHRTARAPVPAPRAEGAEPIAAPTFANEAPIAPRRRYLDLRVLLC